MPDTLTPNYAFVLPEVGGSDNTWGTKLNDNWSKLDSIVTGRRNLLINGAFDIWQRGTTFTGPFYTADRWRWDKLAGGVGSFVRILFPAGQTDVPGNPTYYAKANQTTVPTDPLAYPYLLQRIENVRTLAGKTVTLSLYTYGDAEETVIVSLLQNFGTAGSASVITQVGSITTGNGAWKKNTLTFTVPSIDGKTIDDAVPNHYLQLWLQMPLNKVFAIRFANIQLEDGDVATPFEQRHIADELALCQRYFEVGHYRKRAAQNSGTSLYEMKPFGVQKRVKPTMATSNVSLTNCSVLTVDASGSVVGGEYRVVATPDGTATVYSIVLDWTADAEL